MLHIRYAIRAFNPNSSCSISGYSYLKKGGKYLMPTGWLDAAHLAQSAEELAKALTVSLDDYEVGEVVHARFGGCREIIKGEETPNDFPLVTCP